MCGRTQWLCTQSMGTEPGVGFILLLFKHFKVIKGTRYPIGMGMLGRGPAGALAGCCCPLRRHQRPGFDCGVEGLPEARPSL